ncbi:MAG: response regulator [Pseudomonadota bacterium]
MAENILIVDDIGKNIQVMARILSNDKYAISYATDGQKALEMVRAQDYDLILLDIIMPDMDGFEVCRKIKQMPGKKDIPIIYLTALTQKENIVQGLESGAVDYIIKPFNSTELKARVNTHLELKKAKDHITIQNSVLQKKNDDLKTLNKELNAALDRIKTLEGIIPICCVCKKIRDDKGYWEQIEQYISKHSKAAFSHGICPECMESQYPEFAQD